MAECPLSILEAIHLKVVEASPDAKIVCDSDGKIVVFNVKAELLFGYAREEVLGKDVEMLLPEMLRDGHKRYFSSYFDNPETREMGDGRMLKGRHRNSSEFQVQIKLAPLVATGAGVFALAVVRRVKKEPQKPESQ